MQIYLLASLSLALFSAVQAGQANESLLNTTSGSDVREDAEAGVGTVVSYNTFLVADWETCAEEVGCKKEMSMCVRHSKYYAQCKPAVLPPGDLCGQSDGTNEWKYDHCTTDETCKSNDKDFHCSNPSSSASSSPSGSHS